MQTTLLIDSDIVAYRFAASAQKSYKWGYGDPSIVCDDISEVTPLVDDHLFALAARFSASIVICLSCATVDGWRIKLLPTYKAGRGAKPLLLEAVKDHMRKNYQTFERPTLEADDVMGILSTHPTLIPGKKIIVSIDKDMKTIPGWLFDGNSAPRLIGQAEADYWHMMQTLVGDTCDNYKGCPGIGPKKAEALLLCADDDGTAPGGKWPGVVAAFQRAYEKKTRYATAANTKSVRDGFEVGGYELRGPVSFEEAESYALLQARIARICRASDYDFKAKEVKLWTPPH